jgi:hypothetical protein
MDKELSDYNTLILTALQDKRANKLYLRWFILTFFITVKPAFL